MMNKRINPLYFLFSAVLLVMAATSLSWSFPLFCAETAVALITAIVVLISNRQYKKYISNALNSAVNAMTGKDKEFLSHLPTPAVILGKGNKVLWYNAPFERLLPGQKSLLDKPISPLIPGVSIDSLVSSKSTEIEINGSFYTVLAAAADKITILYFIDNTEYIRAKREYEETRPAVAVVFFDNRYELERDFDEDQLTSVVLNVENSLQKWAGEYGAMFVKTSRNQYVVFFEEKDIKRLTEEKFKILDDIRSIQYGENRSATVSIGIGHHAESYRACESLARKALEMCKGRGGDQAAITDGGDYKFFGGVSMGVETYDKARARVVASVLTEKIRAAENVIIMGHRFSDLDCVGSAIGLWGTINKSIGVPVYITVNKKTSNAKLLINKFEECTEEKVFISTDEALDIADEKTLLIIVDTHSPTLFESEKLYKSCQSIVIIDHHRRTVDDVENAEIFFHEPFASSAAEMVTELIQYMGDSPISKIEAEALLSGIMLDTKNFVLRTGIRTFEAAAYLKKCGADAVEAKGMLANNLETYKNKLSLVAAAEIYKSCAITFADKSMPDIRITASQAADELLYIEGVDAAFAVYPADNSINVSARSLGKVNVQLIMEAMGGGGHHTMAATQLKGTNVRAVIERLHSEIDNLRSEG